jgi:hypothetical protein
MDEQQKIAELEAKLAVRAGGIRALEARVTALQNQQAEEKPSMYIKLGNKRNVVVGGKALGQRFPVTLYAPSWLALLEQADEIKEFIKDNHDALSWER